VEVRIINIYKLTGIIVPDISLLDRSRCVRLVNITILYGMNHKDEVEMDGYINYWNSKH
jgi:hypothetical protein